MHIIPHMTGEPDDIRMTSHVIPLQTSRSLACLTTDDDLDAVNTVKEGALPDASMQSHDFRAPTESDGGRSAYGKQSRSRAGSAGTTSDASDRTKWDPEQSSYFFTQKNIEDHLLDPVHGDASEAWAECARQAWEHELETVEKWKDEINTSLVFAGLFSSALTAFNVQYYVSLQPQAPDATTQLLAVMSEQLRILAAAHGHTATSLPIPAPTLDSTQSNTGVAASAISINVLWFSALVFSLSAASIALYVNQWLHHHINRAATLSRQSSRIWYFRRQGLVEWWVPEIIGILPVLLQISLALFLVGLVELLWTLNTIVAGIVTPLVAVLLVVSMGTVFIPAFAPNCPYKTPQAWWFFLVLRWFKTLLHPFATRLRHRCSEIRLHHRGIRKRIAGPAWDFLSVWCNALENAWKFVDWRDVDSYTVRSRVENPDEKLAMLVEADAVIMDESFLEYVVRPCLQSTDLKAAIPAFYSILQRRAHWSDNSTSPPSLVWYSTEEDTQPLIIMGHITLDMFARLAPWNSHYSCVLQILDSLLYAMPRAQAAVSVYCRLFSLLRRSDLSVEVRSKVIFWVYLLCDNVSVRADHIRILTTSARAVGRDLDPVSHLRVVVTILRFAAKLSPQEFAAIRQEVQDLVEVAIERPHSPVREAVGQAALDDRCSCLVHNFLRASVDVASIDASVYSPSIVSILDYLVSQSDLATDHTSEPLQPTHKLLQSLRRLSDAL